MNKQDYKLLFLFLILFFIQKINAQLEAHLINGEGWLKGDFIEMGLNAKGVYGAFNDNKPMSFHDNREYNQNDLFGFIANPEKDGWVDYDGDFFASGNPEESFGIQIDGENYNNFNTFESNLQIPGEINSVNIISSTCFEDVAQIIWQGNIEGINIKRYFSVTKNGLFIQMNTYLKNNSAETKQDVFFMHNVDPDNNATLSGIFDTDMTLISQASSVLDNISLVTASQQALNTSEDRDGSYVSFYSKDENARVSYGGFENRNAQDIWLGNTVTNTEGSFTPFIDKAISIAFNLGDLEPDETRKFTYYYVLREVDVAFTPLIVNILAENPSSCNGNDGKIIFSGLDTGTTYSMSYYENGNAIPIQNYIANANGEIELQNLSSGNYSNLFISYNGCNTNINTEIDLYDPDFPLFNLSKEDLTNCNDIDGSITIEDLTANTNYNFSYIYNNTLITQQNITANINGEILINNLDAGVYSEFTIEQYSCVTESDEVVEINTADFSIIDFSTNSSIFVENNSIEIIPSVIGNYLYSIDNNPYQDSPLFTNITAGNHQFSVTDIYGCEIAYFEKSIVSYSKIFTPNNDGFNDFWHIVGIESLKQPEIFIFDRFGKLLKQLSPKVLGWDGTFNNKPMPTSDYWFKLKFKDNNNNPQEFIKHFTLKR